MPDGQPLVFAKSLRRNLGPRCDDGTGQEVAARINREADQGGCRIGPHADLLDALDVECLHHNDVAVTGVSWRRSPADELRQAGVVGEVERGSGRRSPDAAPAPVGSSITEEGMSTRAQCQKPEPLGASGSYMVTV